MNRVPIRLRLAAAFAVAMALVLAATGLFVYSRVGDDLATALDQDLSLRAQDVSALVVDRPRLLAGEPSERLVERGEAFAELLGARRRVLDASPSLGRHVLLDAGAFQAALRGRHYLDVPAVPGLDEPARILAMPVVRDGQRLVLAVGATRENRAEALRNLRTELLLAGPVALLLATGLGYALAGSGLRAVEAMRRRADAVGADNPGERLPVPPARDELQRLGLTLNAMLQRLQDGIERERTFVADAGHELRTPLALLRAELDYALHYADSEAELRAAIRTAGAETDRLVQLAGSLLLLAGSDNGGVRLRRSHVAVAELLESVRTRFAWRAEAEGRPIAALDVPDDLTVSADPLRLEQAVANLVDNALRHGSGVVRIGAERRGSDVVLWVGDEGPGFEPAFIPRAFQRFSRADDSHGGPGAGLGLAIVSAIATAHDGSATVANAAGGGARVDVRLPRSIV